MSIGLLSLGLTSVGLAPASGGATVVEASVAFIAAASVSLGGSTRSVWRVPTNAAPGTSVHVIVFSGSSPTYAIVTQGTATVDASGYASINAASAPGSVGMAFVHNYSDNPATVSIFGGAGIATVI